MALHQLRITGVTQETTDTKSFTLQDIDGNLHYEPGQFLTLLLPGSPHVRRSYSLSSHPKVDDSLEVAVRRIANGQFSRWLFDYAQPGDIVQTIGASGFFTLPPDTSNVDLLFLAAGSGITPIFSLIKEILLLRRQRVVLIYSNRSRESTIFSARLRQWQNQFPDNLVIEYLHSNAQNLLRARLNKSLLSQLIRNHFDGSRPVLAYLCGPHDYMQMATITLLAEGLTANNIRTELFFSGADKPTNRPPDEGPHTVTIHHQEKVFAVEVKYPNTILQSAKLKGIELPYSCEAGRCGTCAATCTKGEIWMSRNEVLLDSEIARGRVLTCTGYPINGSAELHFIFEQEEDQ